MSDQLQISSPMEHKWIGMMHDIMMTHIDPEKFAVFVYGSRATHTAVRSSDVDIGIWGRDPVPASTLASIREAIDESDIPFHYDIVDFSRVDESFKTVALEHIIPWNQSSYFTEMLKSYSRP